ncbi:gamma carbonic anhydrase family protein [Flavobacteriales bacterium]|nr:gamma carbonic anhydrase family protein [Flavobacteriales bacterium]MDO7741559.1 gamma carbonic anhydrase family protein [Flavobacteriales bacterium]|tara:strand:+ start:72 stop:671 length:600 start_codon:yes stop_codon:yes gene_type:complete
MIQSFREMIPVVHPSSYVHPMALVIGHVTIGPDCYIGSGAVLRGDWGRIVLESGCNVQENAVLHMFPGATVHLKKGAHIGHGAMIHGATIGEQSMVGMNAVILDDVELGSGSIVGALAMVKAKSMWDERSLVVGNPAKCIGEVSDAMLAHKIEGTALYQRLPADMMAYAATCEALTEGDADRPGDFPSFDTWQSRKAED